jgi:hypothetical protein
MKSINDSMSEHASITLADGTVIGAQQRRIRYQDVSGPIYTMLKAVVSIIYTEKMSLMHLHSFSFFLVSFISIQSKERAEFLLANPGSPISPRQEVPGLLTQKNELLPKLDRAVPSSILRACSFGKGRKPNIVRRVVFAPLPENEIRPPETQSYRGPPIPSSFTAFQSVPVAYQHHPSSWSQMVFNPYAQNYWHSAGHGGTPQPAICNNLNEPQYFFRPQHVNRNYVQQVEYSNRGSYEYPLVKLI